MHRFSMNGRRITNLFSISSRLTLPTLSIPEIIAGFLQHILDNIWEIADLSPLQCLLWLAELVGRHKAIHGWVVRTLSTWADHYLLAHDNQRVRGAACSLFVSLVPSCQFQVAWKAWRVGT